MSPAELHPPSILNRDGFVLVPGVLRGPEIDRLRSVLEQSPGPARARRAGRTFGARNLLDLGEVSNLAAGPSIRALVEPVVGRNAVAVRALFFDKTAEANWPVLWHQDLTIAVAERHDRDGWGPWSVKAGVPHVEPPPALLATMLTVRVHLDDCPADNGPLRVIPGSHALGRLSRADIKRLSETTREQPIIAPTGSALLMRPLLLHASSPAKQPSRRRVIHIEFADADLLPAPIMWATRSQTPSPLQGGAGAGGRSTDAA